MGTPTIFNMIHLVERMKYCIKKEKEKIPKFFFLLELNCLLKKYRKKERDLHLFMTSTDSLVSPSEGGAHRTK